MCLNDLYHTRNKHHYNYRYWRWFMFFCKYLGSWNRHRFSQVLGNFTLSRSLESYSCGTVNRWRWSWKTTAKRDKSLYPTVQRYWPTNWKLWNKKKKKKEKTPVFIISIILFLLSWLIHTHLITCHSSKWNTTHAQNYYWQNFVIYIILVFLLQSFWL